MSFEIINTKLSKVDYACLEDPEFLNLKQNAENFYMRMGKDLVLY